jgi:hypothetical protein
VDVDLSTALVGEHEIRVTNGGLWAKATIAENCANLIAEIRISDQIEVGMRACLLAK